MSDRIEHDITSVNTKLQTFMGSLTPGERQVMSGILEAARDGLSNRDVAGYDAGDLVTKINWDALTTMSVTPTQISDRNLGPDAGSNR